MRSAGGTWRPSLGGSGGGAGVNRDAVAGYEPYRAAPDRRMCKVGLNAPRVDRPDLPCRPTGQRAPTCNLHSDKTVAERLRMSDFTLLVILRRSGPLCESLPGARSQRAVSRRSVHACSWRIPVRCRRSAGRAARFEVMAPARPRCAGYAKVTQCVMAIRSGQSCWPGWDYLIPCVTLEDW